MTFKMKVKMMMMGNYHEPLTQPIKQRRRTKTSRSVQVELENQQLTPERDINCEVLMVIANNNGSGCRRSDKFHKMKVKQYSIKKLIENSKNNNKKNSNNNNGDLATNYNYNNTIKKILSPFNSIRQFNKRNGDTNKRTKWCLLGSLLIMTLVSITLASSLEQNDEIKEEKKLDFNLKVSDLLRKTNSIAFSGSSSKQPNLIIANNNINNKKDVLDMSGNSLLPTFLALAPQQTNFITPNPLVQTTTTTGQLQPVVATTTSSSLSNQQQPITTSLMSLGETRIEPLSTSPSWLPVEPLVAADSKKKKMMKKKKKMKKMEKKHKEWKKGKKHKKKKYESKKKKGGMSKKKKGKKEKKKWGMEKKGHKKKGNFKKKKWGKKKKMKKGQKKGKKGHKMLKDKGHKKKGFKKVYHKEEWGKKKKWHDIKREKKWNTKQKKWKKKWHQEKGKKYKGKHMKKYHKKNKHGKKYKKEKKSKWKKHKGEKFKKGHKKKKEEYSKKKEGGKKKKMKKMEKKMKKKKKSKG